MEAALRAVMSEGELAIVSLWENAQARWPSLRVDFEVFRAFVLGRGGAPHDRIHGDDLFLACACLSGVSGAVEVFQAEHAEALARFVRTVDRRPEAAQELVQDLMVSVLVGDRDRRPRLEEYSGRGPLQAWLRMAAHRRTLNAVRNEQRRAELDARIARETLRAPVAAPELDVIRQRHKRDVESAFRDAIATLSVEHRGLLRLFYGEGLGLTALATIDRCSKATMSRRLAKARFEVLRQASLLLRQRLHTTTAELHSLIGLLGHELDLSLTGLLVDTAA